MPAKGMRFPGKNFWESAIKASSASAVQMIPLRLSAGEYRNPLEYAGLTIEHAVQARADAMDARRDGMTGNAFHIELLPAHRVCGNRRARRHDDRECESRSAAPRNDRGFGHAGTRGPGFFR